MSKQIALSEAKCTGLTIDAPVTFLADGDGGGEKADFKIEAYTGAVVDRWWGRLAVDITGIKSKQRMPILRDHMARDIVGYSLKSWKDGSFWVSGRFSKATDTAKEVQSLAEEGFPWQASIGVRALEVFQLESGAKKTVNGAEVLGPAEVWTKSEVFETSFVPMGADGDTSVTRFTKFEEAAEGAVTTTTQEGLEMPITLEQLEKEAPELLGNIRKAAAEAVDIETIKRAAAQAETARILGLAKVQFGEEAGAAFEKVVSTGVTVEQFTAIRGAQPAGGGTEAEKIAAEKAALLKAIQNAGPGNPGSGDGTATGGENGKDFLTLVEEHIALTKSTRTAAMQAVMRKNPAAHKAYIASVN